MQDFNQRGMSLPLILIAIFAIVGIAASFLSEHPDGAIEEISEEIVKNEVEEVFGFPDGTFDIDFSPHSPENKG